MRKMFKSSAVSHESSGSEFQTVKHGFRKCCGEHA